MSGAVRVGDPAPDFELAGVDGATGEAGRWRLSAWRGHWVVVAFYPADDSPVCTAQLRSYTSGVAALEQLDARVLAVSPQSPESHQRFAASQGGFAFPLLSDEDKSVGREYGILGLLGLYRRSTFVVDPLGALAYQHRIFGPGLGYKPVEELAGVIRERRAAGAG